MISFPIKSGFTVVLLLATVFLQAQITFIPNKQQWDEHILFQSDIPSGRAFFGDKKVTYAYYSTEDLLRIHDAQDSLHTEEGELDERVRCFAFEVEFAGAQSSTVAGKKEKTHRVNYFIGNDAARWASNVPVYETLEYSEIYPGINIQYYGSGNQLKYDFIVAPGADPSDIRMKYSGQRSIRLDGDNLVLDLGFTMIKEVIPVSYQLNNGVKRVIRCSFALVNNEVHFVFPEGYDPQLPLIIDPVVIASTYSGGTGQTAGYSATYDDEGNIYSSGTCFAIGFPVTPGAYNVMFSGSTDLGISKYNPDGSRLLYCTYIGGGGGERPHSMIVHAGNLYIYGTTGSPDFPVTAQAYDQSLNGTYDIMICCLNNSGSALLASTYIGGSWTDGINMIQAYYPDAYRGEIIGAANGDVLIASGVLSQDFPTTSGAYRTSSTGGQDAVIFRMNSTLSGLIWSTFIGSGVHDIAYSIRESADGSVYACGITNNMFTPFPAMSGCYQSTSLGSGDAFIAKFSSDGSTLLACTFYGGAGRDIAYFMDIDIDGDVYIFGESRWGGFVTPGVYAVPGSRNFIAKLNPSLTALLFSTVIGNGPAASASISNPAGYNGGITIPRASIVPTAFRVDYCKRIYFAGWGADHDWTITEDALYPWSDENMFYVGVLEEDATALLSATMYPGTHVDGGMSRFDPHGVLYEAVCESGTIFPTTSWAFSDGSVAGEWDVCVFKLDMKTVIGEVILPNVFTPNGDGINDVYDSGVEKTRQFEITICDRWGTKVFSSTDVTVQWDGTLRSSACEEGVYFVTVKYGNCEPYIRTGFVHLLRGD